MARYLATFIFNEFNQGWSESYYTKDQDLVSAQLDIVDLGKKRAKLLPKSATFTAARLSDVNIVGDAWVSAESQLWPKVNLAPDVTNTALETRLQVGATNFRTYWMRCLPDDWVIRDIDSGKFIYSDPFVALYTQFFDALVTAQIAIYGIDKPGATVDQPLRTVKKISAEISGPYTDVQVDVTVPNFAIGESVRLRGLKGPLKPYNGKYVVTQPFFGGGSVGTISLPFALLPAFTPADYATAYIYSLEQRFQQVTSWQALDLRTRQTGRPFGQPRGRRSAR